MAETSELIEILGGTRVLKARTWRAFQRVTRAGLPWASCAAVTGLLELSQKQTAHVLSMAPRTLARRKDEGRLKADESDRLVRVARIIAHATRALATRGNAIRWLHRPNRALGGERPIDLLDTDLGTEEVDDVLGRLEHGVVS